MADGSTPTLSPDGAWIAFNSWLEPRVRLILAQSDGSGWHIIARFDNDAGRQRWSPDSTQIAFIGSTEENGFGTYVYDLATVIRVPHLRASVTDQSGGCELFPYSPTRSVPFIRSG